MAFDPIRTCWTFTEEGGRLRRCLLENPEAGDPVGNFAYFTLIDVACAWLTGWQDEIAPVLVKALGWLDRAVQTDEELGESHDFHRRNVRWSRGLGQWMSAGIQAEEDWTEAMRAEKADWAWGEQPLTRTKIVRDRLDDYMAFCVQASRFAEGMATFESYATAKKLAIGKLLKPREYAYALCLHQCRGEFDEDALFAAGRLMLQANLEEAWLGMGQANRAATWLKIVYWDRDFRAGRTPSLTPLQTVLKAYENMPHVQTPPFVTFGEKP